MVDPPTGIEPSELPRALFPFQHDIVAWALRRGRAALFAGTGLGKSLMELAWGEAVSRATGKAILHLAPLAVSAQMIREAEKFGIPALLVREQDECAAGVNVTNYQKLEHFDIARSLQKHLARIAHVQLDDNPGRNEPGTGEINYPFLFRHLDAIGYRGWVGCEYKPRTTRVDGLGWHAAQIFET